MTTYTVSLEGREFRVCIGGDGDVSVEGNKARIEASRINEGAYSILIDGEIKTVSLRGNGQAYEVLIGGIRCDAIVESERDRLLQKYSSGLVSGTRRHEVHAPMPALVVRVEVNAGDDVIAGQAMVVLEAMKMENELKAHQSGRVKKVFAAAGRTVEKGELLLLLE